MLLQPGEERVYRIGIADIRRHGQDLRSIACLSHRFLERLLTPSRHDDRIASLDQRQSAMATDAASGTGNKGNFLL